MRPICLIVPVVVTGSAMVGVIDHMFLDGLEDAYDRGRLMGTFAEDCAEAYQFTQPRRTILR